jgi:hypothetical protein
VEKEKEKSGMTHNIVPTAQLPVLPQALAAGLASIEVTPEAYYDAPKITPHLKNISSALRGECIRRRPARGMALTEDGIITPAEPAEEPPLPLPQADLLRTWPALLTSSEDPDCRKVLYWYRVCPGRYRNRLPIEAFCCAAKVSPTRLLEHIVTLIVRQGAQAATIITGLNQPRVVQKSVEMALRDEGVSDRALFHKASGWTPTPKSAQTNITVTQAVQASSNAQSVAAPAPESTIRRLSDRFNEAPRLVAPAPNVPTAVEADLLEDEEEAE